MGPRGSGRHSELIGCDALERPLRFRHIAVRILYTQLATMVSRQGFRVLTEVATFPEVGRQELGLWRGISAVSRRNASNPEACLCWLGFQYPKFGAEASRDRLRFRGDRFECLAGDGR
jgi:hypothetical protein